MEAHQKRLSIKMHNSLEELYIALSLLPKSGGAAYKAVPDFLIEHNVQLENMTSGVCLFLWLKSAPIDSKPEKVDVIGYGEVLNMPTYGGMLNQRITDILLDECKRLRFLKKHKTLEGWIDTVQMDCDDSEEIEASETVSDFMHGFHDYMDIATLNYLDDLGKLSELDVRSLLYYGEIYGESLMGTRFCYLRATEGQKTKASSPLKSLADNVLPFSR